MPASFNEKRRLPKRGDDARQSGKIRVVGGMMAVLGGRKPSGTHKNRHQAHTEAAAVVVSRGPLIHCHLSHFHTVPSHSWTVTELLGMLACIQVDSGYVYGLTKHP